MLDDPAFVVACWACAFVILAWTWLPALISGLGGARFMLDLRDTVAFDLDSCDLGFMEWYVKARNAGFEPLGQGRMRVNFAAAKWRAELPLAVFYSRKEKAYLIIQQQWPALVWTPAILATCWSNGGLLLTNSAVASELDEGEYTTQGIETSDLGELLTVHNAHVQRMIAKGYRVDADSSLEPLRTALQLHTGPAARYQYVRQGQTFLALRLVIHALLSLPIVWVNGWQHIGVPSVNLVLGLVFSYSDFMLQRKQTTEFRAKYQSSPAPDQA